MGSNFGVQKPIFAIRALWALPPGGSCGPSLCLWHVHAGTVSASVDNSLPLGQPTVRDSLRNKLENLDRHAWVTANGKGKRPRPEKKVLQR